MNVRRSRRRPRQGALLAALSVAVAPLAFTGGIAHASPSATTTTEYSSYGVTVPVVADTHTVTVGGGDTMGSGPTFDAADGATLDHSGELGNVNNLVAGATGGSDYGLWFKPDLSVLPSNAVVTSATLSITAYPQHQTYTDPFGVVSNPEQNVVNPYVPGTVDVSPSLLDWDFTSSPVSLDNSKAAPTTTITLSSSTGAADITALTQSWVAGTQNEYGIKLKLDAGTGLPGGQGYILPRTPSLTINYVMGVVADSGTPADIVTAATAAVRNNPEGVPGEAGQAAADQVENGGGDEGNATKALGALSVQPADSTLGTVDSTVTPPDNTGPDAAPDPGDNATNSYGDTQQDPSPSNREDMNHRNSDSLAQVLLGTTAANVAEQPVLTHVNLATATPATTPAVAAGGVVPASHGRPNCNDQKYYANGAGTPVNRSYYCWYSGELGRAYFHVVKTCVVVDGAEKCRTDIYYNGVVYFHFDSLGTAYNKIRSTDFGINIHVDQIMNTNQEPNVDVGQQGAKLEMNCQVIPADPAPCGVAAGAPASGTWRTLPTHFGYTFTSGNYGSGTEQFDTYKFFYRLTFQDKQGYAAARGGSVLTSGVNIYRCDSASYLTNQYNGSIGQGCVFHTSNAIQTPSRSDPNSGVEAQHIFDAFYNSGSTVPAKSNKVVPGALGRAPLTRTVPIGTGTKNYYNHQAAVSECRKVKKNYTAGSMQCDEFPYASTYQGAAVGDNNFSARAIPASQNSSAGGKLGFFLATERICDHVDDYYVMITN